MTKDGNILEQLVKIRHTYELNNCKIEDKPVLRFDNVTYNNWVKIRRLIKKLNCGVLMEPEGNLDTINLISHHRQYDATLKEAFDACKKHNLPVGCSLVFMPKKLKWMNK
jgi:hypothetical protein